MIYDLTLQAEKQKELDSFIKDNIEISDDEYWTDRVVALNVELNELINEIRFFKYWSKKPASDKKIILDEFVDCIHFSLSLGNTLGVTDFKFIMNKSFKPIKAIYFEATEKVVQLMKNKDKDLFRSLLENILQIAWFMGYSMEDVQEAYDIKNKVNYERQNTGY